jgi:hypothetical protein
MTLSIEREYTPDPSRCVAALLALLMKVPASAALEGQPSAGTEETCCEQYSSPRA